MLTKDEVQQMIDEALALKAKPAAKSGGGQDNSEVAARVSFIFS
jgi:hypothetical protein